MFRFTESFQFEPIRGYGRHAAWTVVAQGGPCLDLASGRDGQAAFKNGPVFPGAATPANRVSAGIQVALAYDQNPLYFGTLLWFSSLNPNPVVADNAILRFTRVDIPDARMDVVLNGDGTLSVRTRKAGADTVLGTTTLALKTRQWQRIEWKLDRKDSNTGLVEHTLRVNTVPVLTVSRVEPHEWFTHYDDGAYPCAARFMAPGIDPSGDTTGSFMDDLFLLDGFASPTPAQAAFPGDLHISVLKPRAYVHQEWLGSVAAVATLPYTDASGNVPRSGSYDDIFAFAPLPAGAGTILGVRPRAIFTVQSGMDPGPWDNGIGIMEQRAGENLPGAGTNTPFARDEDGRIVPTALAEDDSGVAQGYGGRMWTEAELNGEMWGYRDLSYGTAVVLALGVEVATQPDLPANGFAADQVVGQPSWTLGQPNHGSALPDARGLSSPAGLWAGDGRILVADAGNNRVLQFGTAVVPPSDLYLTFSVQPGGAAEDQPFGVQPEVRAVEHGILVADLAGEVTLAIEAGTGSTGATLTGDTAPMEGGVARFSAAQISKYGFGYRIVASCGGATPGISDPFDVVGDVPPDLDDPRKIHRMIPDTLQVMGSNRPRYPWVIGEWALPIPPSEMTITADVVAESKVLLSLKRVDIEERLEAAGGYRRTPYKTVELGWGKQGRDVYDLLLPLYEFAQPVHIELGAQRDGFGQTAWTPNDANAGRLYFGIERSWKPGSVRVYVDGTRVRDGISIGHENGCVTFLQPLDPTAHRVSLDYVWWPLVIVSKLTPGFTPGYREPVLKTTCTMLEIPWSVD